MITSGRGPGICPPTRMSSTASVGVALPHRAEIAKLVDIAKPLPPGVQRQFLIQQIISEEMESAITGQKPIDEALAERAQSQ